MSERHLIDIKTFTTPVEETTLSKMVGCEIKPDLKLEPATMYRVQLWHDGTASLWQLIADGVANEN
jgi:hypothetical protein